jgi:predicted neuraminidase
MKRLLFLLLTATLIFAQEKPFYEAEFVFPLESWHNHSSSIVEQPNGDLLICWFHGSGERQSDDVLIEGARYSRSAKAWSPRFLMADTPGFPDTNATMFIDSKQRLFLLWPVIIANEWHTAFMKYRISSDYQSRPEAPRWSWQDNILLIPKNMKERVEAVMGKDDRPYAAEMRKRAADKYFSRAGWFTRTHPVELPSGRILVPMYSDGYSMSIMAISDDGGATWKGSEPIVGYGNIQPSVVRKKDGTLVAFMRDNGPPPKRVHRSVSKDDGVSWTTAEDTELPNPGSSVEAIALKDGRWVMVGNDTEKGRNSLLIRMSDDEGATWKWQRHLEKEADGSYHYPSVIEARDGSIHVTYSYFVTAGKAIKHARVNAAWIVEGDR